MKWTKFSDEIPDSKKQHVAVYAPKGLYEDDCDQPSIHILYWFKNGFSEEIKRHREIMKKVTHFIQLPDIPGDSK